MSSDSYDFNLSVLHLLYGLDLLHVIEFFLVVFEWLRQDCVLSRCCSVIELILHRLVHPLSMIDQLMLPLVKFRGARLLGLQLVNEEHFVVLMLALVSHQVHLLHVHSTIVHLLLCQLRLKESGLAICHIGASLFDLCPAFLELLIFLLQLMLISFLATLNSLPLLDFPLLISFSV